MPNRLAFIRFIPLTRTAASRCSGLAAPLVALSFFGFALSFFGPALHAQGPPAPVLQLLSRQQVPASCSLVYAMTYRDVSTPAMRAATARSVCGSYDRQVRQGEMSPEVASHQCGEVRRGLARPDPAKRYTVTVTVHDGKLLYRRQGQAGDDLLLLAYDGRKSYLYRRQTHTVSVSPGLNLLECAPFVLPGAGVADLPLMRAPSVLSSGDTGDYVLQGDVPRMNAGANGVAYTLGQLRVILKQGALLPISCSTLTGDRPTTRWDFLDCERLGGVELASRMRWTAFQGDSPSVTCGFMLQKYSSTPPDDRQFSLAPWIPRNTNVEDYTREQPLSFLYDPNGGSLDTQGDRQELFIRTSTQRVDSGLVSRRSQSGIFLAVSLTLATWGAYLWKRQRSIKA